MRQLSKEMLEKEREKSRLAQQEHQSREEKFQFEEGKRAKKRRIVMAVAAAIILLVFGMIGYAIVAPGKYDKFAKCLTEKGAVMYGENWCKYTNAQKAMFGKSFKYINYVQKSGLKVRPTWVINSKTYEKVQSFERLSELTDCKY